MPVTPRLCGINQHEIEIAPESAVLECIIEYEGIATVVFDRNRGPGDAIPIGHLCHTGAESIQNKSFVVSGTVKATISAAENAGTSAAGLQLLRDPCDDRGLARAAGGDVAHADDGHIHRM